MPGEPRVRDDHQRGKGDHRHLGATETLYVVTSVEKPIDDLERDIAPWSEP